MWKRIYVVVDHRVAPQNHDVWRCILVDDRRTIGLRIENDIVVEILTAALLPPLALQPLQHNNEEASLLTGDHAGV
ncbi:hypothetical protein L484_023215 [Morus notabilis]|uniref:Uncharacterized protein n=1 Tax=Morus notabilis TaxID=981085 RepID=W9SN36_9ROSA|nr:hypothetical protein L484_023215 [Morus notabilis]